MQVWSKFIAERIILFLLKKNLPRPLIYWIFFFSLIFDPSFCILLLVQTFLETKAQLDRNKRFSRLFVSLDPKLDTPHHTSWLNTYELLPFGVKHLTTDMYILNFIF